MDTSKQPASYAPYSGTNPSFGQQGPSVAALQQKLNTQYGNTPGYTPLAVDSKFGPKTFAATQFANQQNLLPRVPPSSAPAQNLNPQGVPYNEPTPETATSNPTDPYQALIQKANASMDAVQKAYQDTLTHAIGETPGEGGTPNEETAIQQGRTAAAANADQAIQTATANIANLTAADQTQAESQLATLAKNNLDWNNYKTSDPKGYQNLVTALGGDPNYADALFASSIPPANILGTPQINGSQVTTAFLNPNTGQVTAVTQNIVNPQTGQPINIPPNWKITQSGGGYIIQDANNGSNFVVATPQTYTNQFTGLSTKSAVIQGAGGAGKQIAQNAGWDGTNNVSGVAPSSGTGGGSTGAAAVGDTTGGGTAGGANSSTSQYGLIGTVPGFNPNPSTQAGITDLAAATYLQNYFRGGSLTSGGGFGGIPKMVFSSEVANRAGQLYYEATGQELPPQSVVTTAINTVGTNAQLLTNLGNQVGTITQNFLLSLKNQDENAVNQAPPLINGIADSLAQLAGNVPVAQYLMQTSTIQNEIGSLLAIKSRGTTVADKIAAGDLLPSDLSTAQQTQILNTFVKEATNQKNAITAQNAITYLQNDPAGLLPGNPVNNQITLVDSSGNQYSVAPGTYTPAQLQEALDSGYTLVSPQQ